MCVEYGGGEITDHSSAEEDRDNGYDDTMKWALLILVAIREWSYVNLITLKVVEGNNQVVKRVREAVITRNKATGHK